MKKQELLKLPTIKATKSMMKMAAEDVLKREIVRYYLNVGKSSLRSINEGKRNTKFKLQGRYPKNGHVTVYS